MSDPLPALICGRYRCLRVIGRGGMGVVYEVEHVHTGQHLALKVLTTQPGASAERFKREARAASSIQSDHIVRVTDADVAPELDGAPFLVMELLEGDDLERVTGDRPVAPAQAIGWLRQVARALDKAHAKGIVHRDLKPANLFLTQREDGSGLVKILDFGIAKMSAEATVLTQTDAVLGTPTFMAPEQTESKGTAVTFRADLYALGLIAYRLLTGRNYWKSGTLAQLFRQILVEEMSPPSSRGSDLGPAFDVWFVRACNREPDSRFSSAGEQIEALAAALGLPELQRPVDSVIPVPRTTAGEGHAAIGFAATLHALPSDDKSAGSAAIGFAATLHAPPTDRGAGSTTLASTATLNASVEGKAGQNGVGWRRRRLVAGLGAVAFAAVLIAFARGVRQPGTSVGAAADRAPIVNATVPEAPSIAARGSGAAPETRIDAAAVSPPTAPLASAASPNVALAAAASRSNVALAQGASPSSAALPAIPKPAGSVAKHPASGAPSAAPEKGMPPPQVKGDAVWQER